MRRCLVAVLVVAGALPCLAGPAPQAGHPYEAILDRMYNWDTNAANALLAEYTGQHPEDPMGWALTAGAHLFGEFDRLHILEMDFFADDEGVVDDRRMKADPAVRTKIFQALDRARSLAETRLAKDQDDRESLLAMCMVSNIVADYTTLVERKQWRGVRLAGQSVAYANRLLALDPPGYDAYHTTGTIEYIVGSMPFFVRWFVHYDRIEGDKRRGIENLKLVARRGVIYGPLARILLSVISLREGKLEDARQLLRDLVADYPGNPLFRKELARVTARIERAGPRR